MSKWPMRGHFRYLRFKTFPMTLRTPQWEVFWAFLSNSKHSGVSEDSKSPTLEGFTPTLGQSGVTTDITLLLGIINRFCGTVGSMDNLAFDNLAQLVFHYVFSFWFRLCNRFSTCIFCIILTKYYCSFCSYSQSTTNFFLIGYLSLNTYYLITLLLVIAILTSTIWTKELTT
jgi:hypothetical protein